MSRWKEFLSRMHELRDLDGVFNVLNWDDEVYAPLKAHRSRANQIETIESIRHQRLVSTELGDLIAHFTTDPTLNHENKIAVLRLKRLRDRSLKVPESLVKELAIARSNAARAWRIARQQDDFKSFQPHLEEILKLTRQKAEALAGDGEAYDALLDEYEPEMTTAVVRPVLEQLRDALVPLVEAIADSPNQPDCRFLQRQTFPDRIQWDFTQRLLRDLGFDFEHGRQDRSAHPFCESCSEEDVRLTTRLNEKNPLSGIFSTIHECGHGLYEQGYNPNLFRTYIAMAPSMGIHESQSRLWENQVGRGRAFWRHYLPELKKSFSAQLEDIDLEQFYSAINVVKRSLIRVEADELTYNLHILLRFELETALLSRDLAVKDLPGAWRERMKSYLGVEPQNDADGCLQDVHWAWGILGYFPTYTIGNIYSAQLMSAYEAYRPNSSEDFARGDFEPLRSWLRENIHRKGYLKSARETVHEVAGADLETGPLLTYLKSKFGEIYNVVL